MYLGGSDMAHVKIQYDVMDAFCMDVFQKFGFTKDESRIISDVLLLSDVYGIESHGAQRLTPLPQRYRQRHDQSTCQT